MPQDYELVVVGSGEAAMAAAWPCREAGWRVAMIDERPLGGTCSLRGCDPKRLLAGVAEAWDRAKRLDGKGLKAGGLALDWAALMGFKRALIDPRPPAIERGLREAGIDAWRGATRFIGPDTLEVAGERLHGRHILIAAGARPTPLGIPGEAHLATSDDFLELDRLPERIVFIGGGYIAAELSHLAARCGAQVTVLQRGPRLLAPFDPDLVDALIARSRHLGIEMLTHAAVEAVERGPSEYLVQFQSGTERRTVAADRVVHAAGRSPNLEGLDLDAAGVERDARGRLHLNAHLQSVSNPAVYAAGDAAARGPALTPAAAHDGAVVADNLLHGARRVPDYSVVPSVVFTVPPLASVGLTEAAARERGMRFKRKQAASSDWYAARRVNEEAAGFKVLVDEDTDQVLGAHLLGPHADEVINVFALAMRAQVPATRLAQVLFAYPTGASELDYMLP